MSNPIDNAIENAENTSRRGGPRGFRDRFFLCAALSGQSIVHEFVKADSLNEAKVLFEQEHGLTPTVWDDGKGNGFYQCQGTGQTEVQRISVTVTPAQLVLRTAQSFKAQFRGWNVFGSGLKACTVKIGNDNIDFNDNELISIEFGDRVDSNSKVQKPKLKKREVIRVDDLQYVEQL